MEVLNHGGVIVGEYDVRKSRRVNKNIFKSSKLLIFFLNFKIPSKRAD